MKKVLVFSIAYEPFLSGAELAVSEITKRLPGIRFDLITLRLDKNLPRQERIGNVNVWRIGFGAKNPTMSDLVKPKMMFSKYLFPFIAAKKARSLHKKNSYDAIWSLMANYAGFAALFFKIQNPKVPFLLTLQEGDPIDYIKKRVRFVWPLFKKIFSRADYIQAISHYLADFARQMGAQCKIEIVPNGVDFKKFSRAYTHQEISAIKEKLGIKPSEKVIISLSRLVGKNGLADLIDAFAILKNGGLEAKLVIAFDGPMRRILETKVKNMGLCESVLFLGSMPNDIIPDYLAVSDVFVRPSLSEGQGVSFLEAMAASIPIVGTPVGGIPDFLIDGETGLFCEVSNPKSIADKVKVFLENRELKNKIVANAKKIVEENYDWDLIAKKMGDVFRKLCQEN